jgi:hypothetical protein
VEDNIEKGGTFVYTDDQLMARLKFFIGVCLSLTLTGIVFVVLYSLIFVTQPLNAISPIDQKFFELIVPIATFLTGTLSGIMLAGTKKEDQEAMITAQKLANENFEATKKAMTMPPPVQPKEQNFGSGGFGGGSFGGFGGADANMRRPMSVDEIPPFNPSVNTGFGGRPAPVQPPHPEI